MNIWTEDGDRDETIWWWKSVSLEIAIELKLIVTKLIKWISNRCPFVSVSYGFFFHHNVNYTQKNIKAGLDSLFTIFLSKFYSSNLYNHHPRHIRENQRTFQFSILCNSLVKIIILFIISVIRSEQYSFILQSLPSSLPYIFVVQFYTVCSSKNSMKKNDRDMFLLKMQ